LQATNIRQDFRVLQFKHLTPVSVADSARSQHRGPPQRKPGIEKDSEMVVEGVFN
jgi:hypothetical protein